MKTMRLIDYTDGSRWWASIGMVHEDGDKCDFCREHLRAQQTVVVLDQVRRAFTDYVWKGTRVAHVGCADIDVKEAAAAA